MVGKLEVIHVEPISNDKSACGTRFGDAIFNPGLWQDDVQARK